MIRTRLKQDLLAAMKRRDELVMSVLRMAEAAFVNETIAQGHELDTPAELKILQKLVNQNREAAEFFDKGGKSEAAEKERAEIEILKAYLPAELSDLELTNALKGLIAKLDITSQTDFGRLMGVASKQFAGQASGQRIAEAARTLLDAA